MRAATDGDRRISRRAPPTALNLRASRNLLARNNLENKLIEFFAPPPAARLTAAVLTFAALALALSLACSESPDSDAPPALAAASPTPTAAPTATPAPTPTPAFPYVLSHGANASGGGGLIAFVRVALSAPARVAVEYENEYAGKFRTALSERAAEHLIPIARLRANAAYEYAVGVEKPDGALEYAARGEFVSGGLPEGLDGVALQATGRSSAPLIARDYRLRSDGEGEEPAFIAMHDELGEIVWAHRIQETDDEGSDVHAVRFKPNGNIMYLISERHISEITPLGEPAGEIVPGPDEDFPHHDFLQLDGGRVLYIGRYETVFDDSPNGGAVETAAKVDTLNIYDPATGETERVWDPMDFWDIADPDQRKRGFNREVKNWIHMNSLAESPEGGYLVTLRHLDQAALVSPDFQTVRWRLGGPGSDFAFPDAADVFQTPHTASPLPNGNVLLFDNRARRAGGGFYSRALELSLDFETETAAEAWSFSPDPPIHSRIKCSAYRMDNGNTLVAFTWSDEGAPSTIIEADPSGRETFRLVAESDSFVDGYRAYPGPDSIMGETALRPPERRNPPAP